MLIGVDRKILFILMTALLTIVSSACAQTKEEKMKQAQQHSDKAVELRQQGDISKAIEEQLKAIELNKEDINYWINLTGFHLDANELSKAKETAEIAIATNPKNAWGYYLHGEALERLGDEKKGLEERKKAVELEPNKPSFILSRGISQELAGDHEAAKKDYQIVMKMEPENISVVYRFGSLEIEDGNIEKGVELLKQAANMVSTKTGDETFIEAAQKELERISNKKP